MSAEASPIRILVRPASCFPGELSNASSVFVVGFCVFVRCASMRRVKSCCVLLTMLSALCSTAFGLDPRLSISQYAHTAWTFRDGFSTGNIFSMAQTPDGYFWLGGEFGIFRFDGVRAVPWQPPAGQELPEKFAFNLVAALDGTLWIGHVLGPCKLGWRQIDASSRTR